MKLLLFILIVVLIPFKLEGMEGESLGRSRRSAEATEEKHERFREEVGSRLSDDSQNNFDGIEPNFSIDQERGSVLQAIVEPSKASPKTILSRRYLNIDPDEFKTISGESRGLASQQLNTLMKALDAYKQSQDTDESDEEKWNQLQNLESLTEKYLKTKENSLNAALEELSLSYEKVERAFRRIDACNLLLRGIDVERFALEGKVIGHFDPGQGLIPRRGIRFRTEDVLEYQSQYASGMMSSVDRFKLNDGSEHIFKEESPLEELPDLNAEQLSLPKGTTKKNANLAGRSLATYKIDDLLGSQLVPRVGFTSFGGEGKERRGHFQELADGVQLYREEPIRMSDEQLRDGIGNKDAVIESLVQLAMGGASDRDVGRLHVPNFLVQATPQKPLLENGEPISVARAFELASKGVLYFETLNSKKISYVTQEINFRNPHLQRSLANAQLLHFITGELDPNPLNFVYKSDDAGNPIVAVIDSDLSFPDDFSFPDFLQYVEDPAAINLELKKILARKNALQVRELPMLIDEEMGERILDLHFPDDIDEALQGTGLTPGEIQATKNRIATLQQYVKLIKRTVGYANWGDETYERAKKDPTHYYLGYFLETLEFMQRQYQGELSHKIGLLEHLPIRTSTQQAEKNEIKEKLAELESPKPMIQDIIGKIIQKATETSSSSNAAVEQERASYAGSMMSAASKRSTSTLQSFFAAADNLSKQHPRLRKGSKWLPGLPTIFDSSHKKEVHTPTLLFNANKSQLKADRKEYLAQEALAAAEEKILSKGSLEEMDALWQEAVRKLFEAEDAWEDVIKAYEEESPVRERLLSDAKEKKANLISNVLWAQVHRAESAAALVLERTKETVDSERAIEQLIKAQQAWRVLLSHIVEPLTIPLATWEKNIGVANAATGYSNFFPYWVKAAEQRYQSLTASLFQDIQNHNIQERTLWHDLAHETQKMIATERWGDNLLHEIEAQKAYARAQETSIAVHLFKISVNRIAALPIIKTSIEDRVTQIQDARILGVDEKKLEQLCSHWNELVSTTIAEEFF